MQYAVGEALSENQRIRVCRARRLPSGESVILKILKREPAAREDLARFRRELDILSKARAPGVVQALGLEDVQGGQALVLEDIGGASLDRLAAGRPLPLDRFLDLAVGLAATLAGLHRLRIIHGAVQPAHIVLNPATGQFRLIGFGMADDLPHLDAAPQPPAVLQGILDYLSPEQTGRMNRPVDHRSDLYSLGITFYELLTGRVPFEAGDPLGLIHCHIAKAPRPPHEIHPAVPPVLSRIVLKLTAKMAEDRYQSALGLQADLERCRRELRERGAPSEFEVGREDFSDQLRMPEKLFGREAELAQLLQAFERARAGAPELVLVAGYAGVGKTALVHALHQPVAEERGHFLEGKFDQLQRNVPYFAWIQAFTGLVNSLLTESEARLAHWKHGILEAVGNLGRILTEVIPNLELILGPQPPVPELTGAEAKNRFNYVFLRFVDAVATSDHPLVVLLDDLQWIDSASLNLLQMLVASGAGSHLLVIGAYRDNEVDALHPLAQSVESLRREQARIGCLTLQNLSEGTVNELIAEVLRAPPEYTRSLAHLLHAKTGGNPFFLLQTLRALVEQQAVLFDLALRRWRWDLAALERMDITDNVVALMLGSIRELPPPAQQLLPLAACMGFRFSTANLGLIAEQSEAAVVEHLKPALREGLLIPLNGGHQFVHDRVQQAAYSLIPESDEKEVHLRIGKLLQTHLSDPGHEAQLFSVVAHLNFGAPLLTKAAERLDLARLNLRAGMKAKASAAFSAAARYFDAGVALLTEQSWASHYELTLELHTLAAEAASLNADFQRTDELCAVIARHARDVVDMAGAYESKMHCYVSQGWLQEVLDVALEILGRLGLSLPSHPTAEDVGRAMEATRSLHAGIPIEDLIALPPMTDRSKLAVVRIISKASAAAYSGRPALCQLFILTEVSLYIRYGNALQSPYFYAGYAFLLCASQRDVDAGSRFGRLALALLESTHNLQFRSKTLEVINGHVWHFEQHLRTTLPPLEAGYQSGFEAGDLEYVGYNAFFLCCHSYFAGVNLRQLEQTMASCDQSVRRIRGEIARRWLAPFWQATQNLLAESDDPCLLVGRCFDQKAMLPILEQTRNAGAMAALGVNRLMLCYLFEDYPGALEGAELAARNKDGMFAMFSLSVATFYDSLTRLQLYPSSDALGQSEILEKVSANQRELRHLADRAPMNQLHKFYLVEAERMRLAKQDMAALDLYESAISLAGEHQFVQDEALANELAARFWLEKRKANLAQLYMARARDLYESWGAARKVRELEARYPSLLASRPEGKRAGTPLDRLDLATVMKAAHAISSEMEMDRLLGTVLHLAIENTGAQNGFLLLEREGRWIVSAAGTMDRSRVEIALPEPVEEDDRLALGVVRFVARTRERVILDDAAHAGGFAGEPHIRQEQVKSLLCAPLLSRGKLAGIVYLENNLASHAFTPERVQLLETLFSPAATALENARVYQALKKSESNYRRIVDTANEGIWVIEHDSRTLSVNARMAAMLGYRPEEVLGRPLADFILEADLPDHDRQMASRRQGLAGHYERRFRRKDGQTVWTLASASPLFDEQRHYEGSFGMFTDITERKRAEQEALLTSFALDKVREAAFLIDQEARFRFVNEESCRFLGYSREELLGMGVSDIDPDFPGDRWRAHWRELQAKRSVVFEGRHHTRDGRVIPVEINANYFEYDHQSYNLALVRDITERKQAEAAILQLNRELERRVAQRTAALEQANKELETFSYSVSHDLRAPLRHIAGFSQILRDRYRDSLDAKGRRYLDLVSEGAVTMGRLIDDILAFSRMSRADMGAEAVDMAALAHEVFAELETGAAGRRIRFAVSELPRARGDRAMLRQVWSNLLDNALKYTARQTEAVIEISGSAQGGESVYCVKDNGAGFDMRYAEKLFGVFQRLHSAEEFEGTGIGLAMVRRIIGRHGGRVWAEGRVNEGAAFWFTLPTEPAAPMKVR